MAGNDRQVSFQIIAEDLYSETVTRAAQAFALLGKEAVSEIARMDAAFQHLNLRSALDIEAEKSQLLAAFNEIKNSGVASADDVKRAQVAYHKQMEALDDQLKKVNRTTGDMADGNKKAAGSFIDLRSVIGGVVASLGALSLADLARESVETSIRMQALSIQFETITGSATAGATELRFVREEANRLGLEFLSTADAFAKFSAAAKGTALEGEGARRVFAGVTEAVAALHLSADSTERIMTQLTQMMSKNKVTAQDLRVVAESLPGTYTAVARAMGLTVAEMTQQMESGKLLASDVLPKLGEQLHEIYGEGALRGAESTQARLNRFKNEMVDLGVKVGTVLLPILNVLINLISGVGDSVGGVIDLLGPAAPAVLGLAGGVGILTVAWSALTAEVIASTAAFLVNPVFLLVAAGTGAVLGIAAAFNAIADAMGLTGSAAEKSAAAQSASLKASEEKAAREMKILDDYEKAVGDSLDKQLAKEKASFDQSILAVHARYDMERDAAAGNAAKIAEIERNRTADLQKLAQDHATKQQEIRDKSAKAEQQYYTDSLNKAIAYAKAIGNADAATSGEYKLELQKRIAAIEDYYNRERDKAEGNAAMIVKIEAAKEQEIARAKEQASRNAELVGLERQQRQMENDRAAADAEIKLIELQASRKQITTQQAEQQITVIEIDAARRRYENRLQYHNLVVEQYGQESEQAKKSFADLEAAHKDYLGRSLAAYKEYADKLRSIDQALADFRAGIADKRRDLAQRNMTDEQKYYDNLKRAEEELQKYREAIAQKNYDEAEKHNKRLEALSDRLVKKTADGKEDVAAADRALNQVEQNAIELANLRKKAVQDNIDKLNEINNMTLADKSLRVVMDNDALTRVNNAIADLTKPSIKTIIIKYAKEAGDSTGTALGMATGGKLPGESLFDSIPVLARPGEWFIRNESAAVWGDAFMAGINAPFSTAGRAIQSALNMIALPAAAAPVPRTAFALGGQVAALADMGTITLNVGGGAYRVQAPTDTLSNLKVALRREDLRKGGSGK